MAATNTSHPPSIPTQTDLNQISKLTCHGPRANKTKMKTAIAFASCMHSSPLKRHVPYWLLRLPRTPQQKAPQYKQL